MEVTVLVAHPRTNSFNHAISERVVAALEICGHNVLFHDLYAEEFDPLLKAEECYTTGKSIEELLAASTDPLVRQHRYEIASAEGLVVVHPNWWGKPPAILAGWLDRVLVPGVAYRLENATGNPEGLLSISRAVVINTSDTPEHREAEELGDPLASIWGRCVLPYCGVRSLRRLMVGPVTDSSTEHRAEWLDDVTQLISAEFAQSAPSSTP